MHFKKIVIFLLTFLWLHMTIKFEKKKDDVNVSFYIEVIGCSDILNQLVGTFPIQKHLKKKKLSFVSYFRFLIKYKVMIVRLDLMQKEKGTNIYVSCILPT